MQHDAIGMIGLGLLGSAVAERLLGAGYPVLGFDVDESCRDNLQHLGGEPVSSPTEVACCRRIVLSLPDSDVVARAVDEILPALREGAIVVDTTTGDPQQMTATGRRLAECGVRYLDATVGGSSEQARRAEVVVMVGGDADGFAACRDIFAAFARESFYVGPTGSGAAMKLVLNLVLGLNRAVLAEGLSLAKSMGLDSDETLRILKAGPAWSRVMDTKGRKMLTGNFTPQARLSQHLKDVRLILENGQRAGAFLPFSELHATLLEGLEAAGLGGEDNSAIIKVFENPSH